MLYLRVSCEYHTEHKVKAGVDVLYTSSAKGGPGTTLGIEFCVSGGRYGTGIGSDMTCLKY